MNKRVLINDGDSIVAKVPNFLPKCGNLSEGDRVWALRRSDWSPAIVKSIRTPVKDKPRFAVVDLNTKQEYLTDNVLSYVDFSRKLPCVDLNVW